MKNNKVKGFTLIELLVVVAIIGILATVVLSSLGSARKKAKLSAAKAAMKSLQSEMELKYLDYNTYVGSGENKSEFTFKAAWGVGREDDACLKDGADKFLQEVFDKLGVDSKPLCMAEPNSFHAMFTLETGGFFCVDSEGYAGYTSNGLLTNTDGYRICYPERD